MKSISKNLESIYFSNTRYYIFDEIVKMDVVLMDGL